MTAETITRSVWDLIINLGGAAVLVVALAAWLGRIWANRIALADKSEFDKKIESVRFGLQQQLELFKEELSITRRANEHQHQVLSDTMALLSKLLVIIQDLNTAHLNNRDPRVYWEQYFAFIPSVTNHFVAYEIPFLEKYRSSVGRFVACANALTKELDESQKQSRAYAVNFTALIEALKSLQKEIAADMNGSADRMVERK